MERGKSGLWMATIIVYLEPECTESTKTSKPSNSPYFTSHQRKRSRVTSNRRSLIISKTRHLYRHWNCWQKLRLSRINISEVSEVLKETNSPKPVPRPCRGFPNPYTSSVKFKLKMNLTVSVQLYIRTDEVQLEADGRMWADWTYYSRSKRLGDKGRDPSPERIPCILYVYRG